MTTTEPEPVPLPDENPDHEWIPDPEEDPDAGAKDEENGHA